MNSIIGKISRGVKQFLGVMPPPYASETSKVRHLVAKYCIGVGCDVGFGGDKIMKLNCVGFDLPNPYARTGTELVDVPWDVMVQEPPLYWQQRFDYVYSSHLIEDFGDTKMVLRKLAALLIPGGTLILVFPDQRVYERYCETNGQLVNKSHKHRDMGVWHMARMIKECFNPSTYDPLYISNCEIDYNVIIVIKFKI